MASSGDGDDDEDEGREEHLPSCCDYVMHFLTVFWKVLFAFVPPTEYWNGWACFVVSIIVIGLLTAVIGDLASHFGCTVGLRDTVTAVVFVALGTSIPGVLQDIIIIKYLGTSDTHTQHNMNATGIYCEGKCTNILFFLLLGYFFFTFCQILIWINVQYI